MSGHRLVNSASFSAFQFLIAIHQFIRDELNSRMRKKQDLHASSSVLEKGVTTYAQLDELASRIHKICKGHIDWVFKSARIPDTKDSFGPNYWASGQRIEKRDNQKLRYSSPKSLTDTAFQLIKAAKFRSMSTSGLGEEDLPKSLIRTRIDPWMAQLKEADKRPERGPYAFARLTDEITKSENYYLEDHVWIWKALKSIEALQVKDNESIDLEEEKEKKESSDEENTTRPIPGRYSSKEAQREILKRFTTENPASKRRMLAVYRSSSESRFMFRSRDTALFNCMESRFFSMTESTSLVDVWRSTLAAQVSHEENQTNGWESPLRYALALTMACKGFKINRTSTNETIDEAKTVLFRSSWANGLFPGFLNYATKDPEIFSNGDYRDTYWHVSFEVPFMLWKHAKDTLEQTSRGSAQETLNKGRPTERNIIEETQQSRPDWLTSEAETTREVVVTRKKMPFNNLINQESIVEPQDEWLYSEPEFLTFAPDQENQAFWGFPNGTLDHGYSTLDDGQRGIIVDIRRSTDKRTKNGDSRNTWGKFPPLGNYEILQKLRDRKRSSEAGIVKKRLIWLPCGDMITAEACGQSVPASEQESLEAFFERHATYDNFFFDDTTAALNTWKTELHLAFYQLHGGASVHPQSGIPDQRRIPFPCSQSKRASYFISRATMGFRFDGDFFDRYWTCHFIEYRPGKGEKMFEVDSAELDKLLQPHGLPESEKGKQPWRQRKVLELMLFDKILEEITCSTKQIMDEIRAELEDIRAHAIGTSKSFPKKTGSRTPRQMGPLSLFEMNLRPKIDSKKREAKQRADALEDADSATRFIFDMKGEDYLEFSQQSQAFEQVLRVLDDDLGENIEHIERWRRRETDRAPEKPRWTRNDERRYRTTITKMLVSNDKKIRALQRCRANVQSLKTSLESTREYIRDDLNLRGAEDIRIFTYVTATFLPISFATSVFSMGGFPGGGLLGSMIGLAVVALSLTGIALVYDKNLATYASALKDIFPRSRNKHKKGRHRLAREEEVGSSSGRNDADEDEQDREHGSKRRFQNLRQRLRRKPREQETVQAEEGRHEKDS